MRKTLTMIVVALVALAGGATPALARGYGEVQFTAWGFGDWYGGVGAIGTAVVRQDGGPELLNNGFGVNGYLGLRLGDQFSIEAGWMESFHNPAPVQTYYGHQLDYLVVEGWTLDLRVFGPSNEIIVPYVQGGLGVYALSSQYFGVDSAGTGIQLGGGAEFLFGPILSAGARALYRGISLGPPNSDIRNTFVSAVTGEIYIALRTPR